MSLRDPRRDDWRTQQFHDEIAEARVVRQRAERMRRVMWLGVLLGAIGSLAFYM